MQCKRSLQNIPEYFEIFYEYDEIYDVNFPLTEIEIKPKNLKVSWFSKVLKKSSKTRSVDLNLKKNKKTTKIFLKS